MNEKLDPEEVEGIMSRIKAEAVKIVERHGGIVNQFVGDEVLALFGIPTAHEDDPRRAVRAALELHETVRHISPEVEEQIGRPLRMHTGIHSGLIVTSHRDDRDGRVGVTGDTVNTGARLKALAGDDDVWGSPETHHLISTFFETEALAPVEMKGKAEPVAPHRVVGATGVLTKLEAAQQRGFTPHVGRERELSTLRPALDKAIAGQGQFVTIVGEAGLGKSRLMHEFRQQMDQEQVTVLEGRCQSYGAATPYLPWLDALRRGLRIRDEDSLSQRLKTAVANIRAIEDGLEQYIPHYLHLLSIPSEAYPVPSGLQGAELKEYDEAIDLQMRALELEPNSYIALADLAWTLDTDGRYELAVQLITRAIRLWPHPPPNWRQIEAWMNLHAGRYNVAEKIFRTFVHSPMKVTFWNRQGHLGLIMSLMFQGREAEARREAEKYRENPEYPYKKIAAAWRTLPFKDPQRLERELAIMRKVGFEE